MADTDLSPDQNRRLASIVRLGVVVDVDHATVRARLKTGGLLTDWLPWAAPRAGASARDWDPPSVGEQRLLLSPSGETGAGVILSAINQDAHPAPFGGDENKTGREWGDGAQCVYDHAAHEWLLQVPTGGAITLTIGATTLTLTAEGATLDTPQLTVNAPLSTFNGNVAINGGLAVNGGTAGAGNATFNGSIHTTADVIAGTVSLQQHKHSGVQSGGSQTGTPVA
jgi:phage baseplate assembly protein V